MLKKSLFLVSLIGTLISLGGCKDHKDVDHRLVVRNLQCEFLSNPKGVEHSQPYLSWEIDAQGKRNIDQSSYRILVYESDNTPDDRSKPIWDSGRIKSGISVNVKYEGVPLQSAKKYFWKVQIEDKNGTTSQFSDWAFFETGIFHENEWIAKWVHCPNIDSTNCPYLRYDFELDKTPLFAPTYVASV